MPTQQIPRINVEVRDRIGTRYAQRLRRAGRLPAVIYGHKQEPVHVSLDALEVAELLHHNTHLVEAVLADKTEPCLIKQVQWNHLGSQVVHVDLTRVDLSETVTVPVELELVGEAVGLKEAHSIMEHPFSEIEIECRAAEIPEKITLDVSALKVGESLTVADLQLPDGVRCVLDDDVVLATVRVMTAEPQVEEVELAEGAEPQVIGKAEEKEPAEEA